MATASVTNSFTNGLLTDAGEMNTNFSDLVSFLNASVAHLDGSKAFTAPVTGVAPTSDLHLSTRKFADHFILTFTQAGDLAVGTGKKVPLPFDCEIVQVKAYAETAPTGADLQVDVNVDGTTIFTTQSNRPIISAGSNLDTATTIEDDTHNEDQLISVDIDQIGSTVAGADLKVHVHLRRV